MTQSITGSPSQTVGNLTLDVNPRQLVAQSTWSLFSSEERVACLDAIYVPSRGRNEYIARLVECLSGIETPVYLLPSTTDDLPQNISSAYVGLGKLSFHEYEFLSVVREQRSYSNPIFGTSVAKWDLPLKRNYALWHAFKNRFSRILLLDDDIRSLDTAKLTAGANALSKWGVVGFFVDSFPDTSVVGHVERGVGEVVLPFLSGSCLFVRTDRPVGFFPQIYNEDWIFMAPEIAQGHVVSLGSVEQEPYDPFSDASLSAFQEPGEIIADGLFSLLQARDYGLRFESYVWCEFLRLRRSWLRCLVALVKDETRRAVIEKALAKCEKISANDCVVFVKDWDNDRLQWRRALKELM